MREFALPRNHAPHIIYYIWSQSTNLQASNTPHRGHQEANSHLLAKITDQKESDYFRRETAEKAALAVTEKENEEKKRRKEGRKVKMVDSLQVKVMQTTESWL